MNTSTATTGAALPEVGSPNWAAASITAVYLAVASLWIVLSDQLTVVLLRSAADLAAVQTAKGLLYVVVTGLLLFILVQQTSSRFAETARDALRARRQFDALVAAAPVTIFRVDEEGEVSFLSSPGEALAPAAGVLGPDGSGWRNLIAAADLAGLTQAWGDFARLDTGGLFEHEIAYRSAGGQQRWALIRASRLDQTGEEGAFIGIALDVTERKRAEAAARDAKAEAEALARAKSQFLAGISHELRTPLNAIIGFSELLSNDAGHGDPEQRRDFAEEIAVGGRRMLDLVNDLVECSSVELGQRSIVCERIDLRAELSRVLRVVEATHRGNQPAFVLDVDPDMQGYADPRALYQICFNLIGNAARFGPPGGTVAVRAVRAADGGAVITIDDEGPGLPPELRDHHAPFPAVNDAARPQSGLGIGLFIARSLVALHGGTLTLENHSGGGARAVVRLPPEPSTATTEQRF